MTPFRGYLAALLSALAAGPISAEAPTLSVGDLAMLAGETGMVVVSGDIDGQSTFGVEIMAELVARPGNTGTVTFTEAPPVDILQVGDPWPAMGAFTPFDTDMTSSPDRNGSIDDSGSWIPTPVTFSGPMTAFPVVTTPDAQGVWDVTLATSDGDSSFWEELDTTLYNGTITVTGGQAIPTVSEWGLIVLALLLIGAGVLVIAHRLEPRTD
ncbi:MAG: IPTL-CTERM sorting domain-containing protein [Phycisphaerales bacterium]|nr:MAG: IPTL-CTERM sorting domain-containing protein [Phycisphaerales bacterium]